MEYKYSVRGPLTPSSSAVHTRIHMRSTYAICANFQHALPLELAQLNHPALPTTTAAGLYAGGVLRRAPLQILASPTR